jgi:hypothetical protein
MIANTGAFNPFAWHWLSSEVQFDASIKDFVKFSQNSFGKIYNSNNPNEVLKNYITEVKVDGNLAKKCNRVI